MTTPSTNNPAAIIQDAYLDAGLVQQGQLANPDQIVDGMRRLQDIINFEQTQGIKLWLNENTPIPLTAGQGTYLLGPGLDVDMQKPTQTTSAFYRDSTGNQRPLNPLAWADYNLLSKVNQIGAINSYFVNKQKSYISVFFWLIPDVTAATGTCYVLLRRRITQFISLTEEMDFPPEWRIFLRWALADEICTGQPSEIMNRCATKAQQYRTFLENYDVEDAPTRFGVDTQLQTTGNFT